MNKDTILEGSNFQGLNFAPPQLWKSSAEFTKFHRALYKFTQYINTFSDKVELKNHPFVTNKGEKIKYIPIETLEQMLDEVFYGHWCVTDFQTKNVANEYVGSVVLSFLHPISRVWLHRTGAAAVLIKQNAWLIDEAGNYVKDKKGDRIKARPKPSDIDSKIINAMETSYPALLSMCTSNAARKIGRMFGRHLNRYEGYNMEEQTEAQAKFFKAKPITDKAFQQVIKRLQVAHEAGDFLLLKEITDQVDAIYRLDADQLTVYNELKEIKTLENGSE